MSLEILERETVGRAAWDAFANASDEAWLWHLWDFQDALVTWPGYVDRGFAIREEGKLVALVPLHLRERRVLGFLPHNALESLGGPACASGTEPKPRRRILEAARARLESLAARHRAADVSLSLPVLAPAWRGERCPRVSPLLDLGCENAMAQTWVVDLRRSLEEIRGAYSELTRREIKKALQSGFAIREARGERDLDLYHGLHRETCRRTGVAPRPREYFRSIFDRFVEQGLCRIVFLIREGAVIAAQNTASYKGGAQYWTGASRTEKSGGENRLLFDDQIRAAREAGCEWYETGEAFPNVRDGKSRGLSDFKRSFGAEMYPLFRGRLPVRTVTGYLAACGRALRGIA